MEQKPIRYSVNIALDMQIGMEPLVIDWAKEEPKMGQIIRHIYVLYNFFFSQINSAEGVLPNDEFWKKFILLFLKYP